MWRPPQRIQFEPKLGRVPSAEEAAVSPIPADAKLIFSSARAGEESAAVLGA